MIKRPLAAIGIVFLISQAVAVLLGDDISLFASCVSGIVLITYLLITKTRSKTVVLLLSTVTAAFLLYSAYYHVNVKPSEVLDGATTMVKGQISKCCGESHGRYYYYIDTEQIDIESAPQNIRIRMSSRYPLEAGQSDVIVTTVTFNDRSSFSRGSYNSLLADGVTATAYMPTDADIYVSPGARDLNWYMASLRGKLCEGLDIYLSEEHSAIAKAMLFGDKTHLSDEQVSDFRACGLSHLFAVSGLHLSIITAALSYVLQMMGIKQKIEKPILIVAVLFIMALTGFSFSVVRAGIMRIIYQLALLIRRDADSLTSLGFSVLVVCLINPNAASDIGLQLSFSATLGLITLYPKINGYLKRFIKTENKRLKRILYYIVNTVSSTVAACVAVLPVTSICFGEFSTVSIIASLLCILPASAFLIMSVLLATLRFIPLVGVKLSYIVVPFSWITGKYLDISTSLIAKIPGARASVNYDFFPWLLAASMVLLIVWYCLKRVNKNGILSFKVCLLLICELFAVFIAGYHIMTFNKSYVRVYNVENGVAIAAVYRGRCIVIGPGGDEYLAYKMACDIDGQDISEVGAVVCPDSTAFMSSYTADFIDLMDPERVFVGISDSASDDYEVVIKNAASESGCKISDIDDMDYSLYDGKLSVRTHIDPAGFVWTYLRCGEMDVLVCPGGGDYLNVPKEWFSPDCAVLCGTNIANIKAIGTDTNIVVSDNDFGCMDIAYELKNAGFKNVSCTAFDGTLELTSEGNFLRVEEYKMKSV